MASQTIAKQYQSLKLAMFSGKGGVGKTTLACGMARAWARANSDCQILLISTDPAHSLGDVLQQGVSDSPVALADMPNLQVRSLDAQALLQAFKDRYGKVLELLVERGSFVQGEDLTPVWNLSWPGLDELMGILEIQRLLRDQEADRVVVDMAPSGHTLNLFGLMDFLDELLTSLDLFQQKHREMGERLAGRHTEDEADQFLREMKADLADGRSLLQDGNRTACLVVAIPEPMSLVETDRFIQALAKLDIACGGVILNQVIPGPQAGQTVPANQRDRLAEQQVIQTKFHTLLPQLPIWLVPLQADDPVGGPALDRLMDQITLYVAKSATPDTSTSNPRPEKLLPSLPDLISAGRRLVLIGGKGGVGKTTVAAAIAWGMASRYRDRAVRVISIDPAHSLGDAFDQTLGHTPQPIPNPPLADAPGLTGQEVDADVMLDQFRNEYLWELAEMMSGNSSASEGLQLAYGPEAWRRIAAQALPGIDEMLSLLAVIDLLERQEQDLIILDTAPTGHLLRFLEMPTALGDWLAWIFKLWIKYQNVLGRTELMGRLRTLRQRVMQAQKKLKDAQHTEFIGVVQARSAIVAETQRLTNTIANMGIAQNYLIHNRYDIERDLSPQDFPSQTIIRLPALPRCMTPLERVQLAADLLF